MPATTTTPTADDARARTGPPTRRTEAARAAAVLVASVLLGALTVVAQGVLPDIAAPLANSSSGWTLLTALLVAWSRARTGAAAVLGGASFVLLVLGYSAGAHLQGLYYDPTFFGVVGLVAGPVVGVATAWLRATGVRAALGTAVLAGIGVGEAVYGLTVVGDTTDPASWVAVAALALGLVAGMLARRLRGALPVVLAVAGTAVVAGAFLLAYRLLGSVA